jgi:hypothetical protein
VLVDISHKEPMVVNRSISFSVIEETSEACVFVPMKREDVSADYAGLILECCNRQQPTYTYFGRDNQRELVTPLLLGGRYCLREEACLYGPLYNVRSKRVKAVIMYSLHGEIGMVPMRATHLAKMKGRQAAQCYDTPADDSNYFPSDTHEDAEPMGYPNMPSWMARFAFVPSGATLKRVNQIETSEVKLNPLAKYLLNSHHTYSAYDSPSMYERGHKAIQNLLSYNHMGYPDSPSWPVHLPCLDEFVWVVTGKVIKLGLAYNRV